MRLLGKVPSTEQLPAAAAFVFAFRSSSFFHLFLSLPRYCLSWEGRVYVLLLKGPHVSFFLLVTLCCLKWTMLGSWLLVTLNSLYYPRRSLTIRKWSFHLSLVLVPWVAWRLAPSQLRLSTPGALFCFLVIMAQQGPFWAVRRKDWDA